MKPANGTYRLDYKPGQSWIVTVTDDGLETPIGHFAYVPPPPPGDMYVRPGTPDVAIRFVDATHYVAIVGADNYGGSYAPVP